MRISDWCADVCSSYLPKWLRGLGADPRALSIIRVAGDSMAPTLSDGDDILVDGGDAAGRLRDGISVLRMDDAFMVKGIARDRNTVVEGTRVSVSVDLGWRRIS